ncbi:MAG TPA: MBL fold metallo-hydrolase [Nitrososphaera sp.]|nr:MBL fold metallo-hydrolase [Nitrososphaera sp.]
MPSETKWLCVTNQQAKFCNGTSLNSNQLKMRLFFVANESILIRTPGGTNILYDCGSSKKYTKYIYDYLKDNGITKIDFMIASHTHSDHVNGFYWLWKQAEADNKVELAYLYDNGVDGDDTWFTKRYKPFRDRFRNHQKYQKVEGWRKLELDEGSNLRIYLYANQRWPPKDEEEEIVSDHGHHGENMEYRSVWMKIRYKGATMLLEGDSLADYEEQMLGRFKSIKKAHVLKLSEHGSNSGTGENLLVRVRPAFVVNCNRDYAHLPSQGEVA